MDIDESGGCVQTARIDHIRAVRDDHRIRLSHLRDPIAFPCDGTVPDNAVFQDEFCVDNCFHEMVLLLIIVGAQNADCLLTSVYKGV